MIVKQKQLKGAKFEINRESIEFDQLRLEQKKIKNKCWKNHHRRRKNPNQKNENVFKYKIKELKDETPYIVWILVVIFQVGVIIVNQNVYYKKIKRKQMKTEKLI